MKILFEVFILLPFCAALLYVTVGLVTTGWFRAKNPLKNLPSSPKKIHLTTDDGMNPVYTPLLLDLLKEHDVRASFFVLASTATQHPKLLAELPAIDIVVTMGCNVQCPALPCRSREDWGIEDPSGKGEAAYLATAREIEAKLESLKHRICAGEM